MSKCQFCRSGGDCFEWCGVEPQTLYDELQTVKDQLREAVEVVRFYALTSNWDQDAKICSEDHEYIQKWYETLGGKRAREFLAKHERIEFLTKHKLNSEEGR